MGKSSARTPAKKPSGSSSKETSSKSMKLKLSVKGDFADIGGACVSFPSGPPPPDSISAKTPEDGRLYFEVYANREARKKKQRKIVGHTERIQFDGQNFGVNGVAGDTSNYVVGICDSAAETMDLYSIPNVFVLAPTVKAMNKSQVASHSLKDMKIADQRKLLIEAFGSKKKQRAARMAEAAKVEAERVAGASQVQKILESKVKQATEETQVAASALALEAQRDILLPPHNPKAKKVSEVYDPRKIISSEEWEALTVKAEELQTALKDVAVNDFAASEREAGRWWPRMLVYRLGFQQQKNKQSLCPLLYLRYMLNFYRLRFPLRKTPADLAESLDMPIVIVQALLKNFTNTSLGSEGTSFTQSAFMKDKLIVWLLAIALTVFNYDVDVTNVARELKVANPKCSQYFRSLGCIVDTVASKRKRQEEEEDDEEEGSKQKKASKTGSEPTLRARLQIPLVFPRIKKGKKS